MSDLLERADLCANTLCRAVLGTGKDSRNRGLCRPCYKRWQNAGFAGDGPGAPLSRSEAARQLNERRIAERQERLEDYAWLLQARETSETAAIRVGISPAWAAGSYGPAVRRMLAPAAAPRVVLRSGSQGCGGRAGGVLELHGQRREDVAA